MLANLVAKMKRNAQLIEQQAERLLFYKKGQLSREVAERRDARIFALQRQVRDAQLEKEERLRKKELIDSPVQKNKELLAAADDFIDLVSPFSSPASTSYKREVDETSPSVSKRQRTTAASVLQPKSVTPDGRVINRIIDDTPLQRLIEKTMKQHDDANPAAYPPPVCDGASCEYSTGCLHGQRLALVKRLVQLECVLYGKNPSRFNGYAL